MWHLEYPEKKTLKWYENRFLKKVYESINNSTLEKGIKDIILKDGENSLKTLLLSPPEQLYSFNEKLEKELSNKGLWTEENRALLLSAFGYDKFIAKKKDVAYELSENIGSKTCVYCNRIYTFTVDGEKDNNKIVRPDFDHWMLKTEHPLLSMSFFNLIPSCPICNRSIKLEKDFEYGKHIHPYMSKSDASFSFQFVPLPNFEWDVRIVGGSQEELNTAKLLETEQLYKVHGNMEVKDIVEFSYKNSPEYLNELYSYVLNAYGSNITFSEAYKVIMGTDYEPEKFLDRPLAKLKRDIWLQILQILR